MDEQNHQRLMAGYANYFLESEGSFNVDLMLLAGIYGRKFTPPALLGDLARVAERMGKDYKISISFEVDDPYCKVEWSANE